MPLTQKQIDARGNFSVKQQAEEKARRVWSVSLVDLGHTTLRLVSPLTVQIEEYDLEFIASWPEVEAWGTGCDEAAAINALKDELAALYEELMSDADKNLGKLPLRWKRALRAIITTDESKGQ